MLNVINLRVNARKTIANVINLIAKLLTTMAAALNIKAMLTSIAVANHNKDDLSGEESHKRNEILVQSSGNRHRRGRTLERPVCEVRSIKINN